MITIPLEDFVRLNRDARELAQDLISDLEDRYSGKEEYSVFQRRFDRDSETARRVLESTKGCGE